MAQQVIRTEYGSTVVLSNIRKGKASIPVIGMNDSYTATKVTTWYDGSPMTPEKADGSIYLRYKETGEYFRVNLPNDGELFLEKDTVAQLRTMSAVEILPLKMGYYKGVTLNGYDKVNDTPGAIQYYLSDTTEVDDGGSVFEVGGIKLEHDFVGEVDIRYFGLKSEDVNSLNNYLTINSYCVRTNKDIGLTVDINLVSIDPIEIVSANITGYNTTIFINGKFTFRTDNILNVNMSNFTVVVSNNYQTLTSENGSTTIFYCSSNTYNPNRKVSYRNLKCTAIVPNIDGSTRLSGFIRDGGYDLGIYEDIVTENVTSTLITNTNSSSRNNKIRRITGYNFGTLVWAQGDNQECEFLKGINTPIQATNWARKNASTPRGVNGFDVLLTSGSGLRISNIYAENPIERVIYSQSDNVVASDIYSLNGDGVKFVGNGYDNIKKNIYINNVVLEYDENFSLTFNTTSFQIYWVDNYNLENVTITNNNTSSAILSVYDFKRTAKNVTLKNIVMQGTRGTASSIGVFASHTSENQGTIPFENITIENVKAIRSTGRASSTFNRYTSALTETLIKNLKIINCEVNYQKISESGDDFIYRWDYVDGFEAYGNKQNVRGHFVGGISSSIPTEGSSNISIKELYLKASNINTCITATNQSLNLIDGSYMRFSITDGVYLKAIYKGSSLNYHEWEVEGAVNSSLIATDKTFIMETETKADGYGLGQIISNVRTDVVGTVPTSLVNYADGNTNVSVRGDTFAGSYYFKAKVFI